MDTILIADDHAIFREGLKMLLQDAEGLRVVGEAENGEQALTFIERKTPQLAILDVALPKMSGIDVARAVASRHLATKCLMLTMHDEPEIARSAMEAGAMGYILKGHTFDELKAAVAAVLNGGQFISPVISAAVQETSAHYGGRAVALTDRERQILTLIGQGRANKEIADALSISIRTVETHRARIMQKLGIRSHAGLIHYAVRSRLSPAV